MSGDMMSKVSKYLGVPVMTIIVLALGAAVSWKANDMRVSACEADLEMVKREARERTADDNKILVELATVRADVSWLRSTVERNNRGLTLKE